MLISIAMQCKDDNYLGNFTKRFDFVLSKHLDNIKKLKIDNDVQIVICDWGSEKPLIEKLPAIRDNIGIIKYIYVDPNITQKYNPPEYDYSYVHPLNVSFRNCDGDYIVWGDSDGYWPYDSFVNLYNFIKNGEIELYNDHKMDKNKFYWDSRYQIETKEYKNIANYNNIEKYIKKNKNFLHHQKISLNNFIGGATTFLIKKNLLFESTGFYEKLVYWGWQDIELHRRLLRRYEFGGDLEDHGVYVYHLEHYSSSSNRKVDRKTNEWITKENFNINGDDWGLSKEKLNIL